MELCVLHYHYRPGGVRRVIGTGLPALARAGGFRAVRFAGGEEPEAAWRGEMERALHPLPVQWSIHPALGYWSEHRAAGAETRAALEALAGPERVLWAHNLSVGRRWHLNAAVAAVAGKWRALWLHHHDWWWDGRWARWPEMQEQGAGPLSVAVRDTVPAAENVRHFCLHARDAARLRALTGLTAAVLENPRTRTEVSAHDGHGAREFLRSMTGGRPVWLAPARVLRRKNLMEALLMQRLLAPDATVVITGGVSSSAEQDYAGALRGLPLVWHAAGRPGAPEVPALIAAADAVVVTSLQEGFGLPWYEAALAERPLFTRRIGVTPAVPAVCQWRAVHVAADGYDAAAERGRVAAAAERLVMPDGLREVVAEQAGGPAMGLPVDFGSLSCAAQLEVLAHHHEVRPAVDSTAPQAVREFPPEQWAQAFLSGPWGALEPGHGSVLERLAPLVRAWLRRPLLWMD